MICFDKGKDRFNFRVAGVVLHNNKILLHKFDTDDFWALPGGRVELLESTQDTLIREMEEELNEKVSVEKLLWVVENFFAHDNKNYHELAFYYMMSFSQDCPLLNYEDVFIGTEGGMDLNFQWFDLKDIDDMIIYPTFLKEKVKSLSTNIDHIIHHGD